MSWHQVACPAVPSEEADSCKHQSTPQEGANAANHHWVLKQGQDLRQTLSLAVWFRETPCLWVWTPNRKQNKSNISHDNFSSLLRLVYTAKFSSSALLLTADKSMGVTQHSYSGSIDRCYSDPVLFSWLESRDVKVVLATIHCPVLVQLLLSLHTPHLEKQFACWWDRGSLMLPLLNTLH